MSTFIPGGHYLTKSEAAKVLGIRPIGLQYHINKGNIKPLLIPDLGYIFREEDVIKFRPRKVGRPSIRSDK